MKGAQSITYTPFVNTFLHSTAQCGFKGKVDRLIEDCITCPPMEGFERVYFPGELEAMEEAKRTETGIPVDESELAKFFKNLREHSLEIRENSLV
jgi:LDH2 family malate/lactate/ureidoglycolate dehydrogenase